MFFLVGGGKRFQGTKILPKLIVVVISQKSRLRKQFQSGADLGGGAGAPSSGIRPDADPKGPPFVIFWDIPFRLTDPKIFLNFSYTDFEGGARAEKTQFFG